MERSEFVALHLKLLDENKALRDENAALVAAAERRASTAELKVRALAARRTSDPSRTDRSPSDLEIALAAPLLKRKRRG